MAVALKANHLITLLELDEILQITIGDEDLSHTLINIASDFIENFTNRKFIQATYTNEEIDGNDDYYVYLKQYPIESVTTFRSWDTYNNVVSTLFTEHTEYVVYTDEGYIYFRGKTTIGHKNYRCTYIAGYLIADIPYDLKNACAQLAGLIYYSKGKAGISSESMGKYSVTYDKGNLSISGIPVPDDIAGVLKQYRKYTV